MFVYQMVKINFTAINKEWFNKNLFLKISHYLPENTCVVSISFYKLKAFSFQDSNTGVFLWAIRKTPILKNVCEPLTFAFFKLIPRSGWKKPILKTKWQKHINKYGNTFIWKLHVDMKRNHWNLSLNLYYRHAQSNSYRVSSLKSIPI